MPRFHRPKAAEPGSAPPGSAATLSSIQMLHPAHERELQAEVSLKRESPSELEGSRLLIHPFVRRVFFLLLNFMQLLLT